jgi:hypothetical protein
MEGMNMSDMVYVYVQTAGHMAETVIDDLFRSKEVKIEFEFRLDHTCYDEYGVDIGNNIYWKVLYTVRKGSRYIKVDWTPYSYQEPGKVDWKEIGDHDSCWRGCWSDILSWAREELLEKFNAKGNESWFFSCQHIKQL